MRTLKRIVAMGSTAAVAVTMMASGASADELTDYLERANQSTYTANRLVVSVWGGQTQISSSFVEHSRGMEMVEVDSTWTVVGKRLIRCTPPWPFGLPSIASK